MLACLFLVTVSFVLISLSLLLSYPLYYLSLSLLLVVCGRSWNSWIIWGIARARHDKRGMIVSWRLAANAAGMAIHSHLSSLLMQTSMVNGDFLLPSFLPPISLSTSYLPCYLLLPFLPSNSLSTSYLPFYLLPLFLPPTSLATSYFPFYLLPPFLPPTSLSTSYVPFFLLPPFLPPTSLSTSYFPFYLLRFFLPPTFLSTFYVPFYPLPTFLSPTSYLPAISYLPFYLLPPLSASHLFKSQLYHWFAPSSPFIYRTSLTLLIYCLHTPGVASNCTKNPQCDYHRYIFLGERRQIDSCPPIS